MRARRLLAAIVLLLATTLFAHHGPESIVIKAAQKKQGPVKFSHEKHAKLAKSCDTCHHTQKGLTAGNAKSVTKCTTCHLDPKSANIPSMREASLTKNPFHKACLSCHRSEKKGPVACNGCHTKA
jgi:hypothetical protein